ncbi:MAG: NAD(P)H-binding protein, partial [Algoriphagus sp.]
HAFENIDKVIFAAGAGGSSSDEKTIAVDQEGAKKSVDLAKKYHLKKYVMLSSMGAENPDEDSDLYKYLKAKHNADEYLKASGLEYTIVRPGGLTDDKGQGKIKAEQSFDESGKISREDVAKTLVHVLAHEVAHNSHFEILAGDVQIDEAVLQIS